MEMSGFSQDSVIQLKFRDLLGFGKLCAAEAVRETLRSNRPTREWLTTSEAAEFMNITTAYVWRLCKDGKLETNGREHKAKRISLTSIQTFLGNDGDH